MKKKTSGLFSSGSFIVIKLFLAGGIIIYLSGCSCRTYCDIISTANYRAHRNQTHAEDADCAFYCAYPGGLESGHASYQKSESQEPVDSVTGVGNPLPQKKKPQTLPGEIFSNVFTAGPTFSSMNTGGEMNYEGTKKQAGVGVQVGFGTSLPFSSTFSVAPTIRFNQMVASETTSYSSTGGNPSSEFKNTSTYNYIGGNMLAQYRPANHLSIVAGPEISYLVGASAKQSGSSDTGEKESLTKNSNRVGFGLLGGIKYEIPAGNKWSTWGVSLMYDYMLTSVNKKQDNGYDVPSAKIGGVQLGVSYFWKRIKK